MCSDLFYLYYDNIHGVIIWSVRHESVIVCLSRGSSKDQAEMDPADMEDVEEVEEEETGEDVNSKGWSWFITENALSTRECEDEGDD